MSGVLNLSDRTENAGGYDHRTTGVLCGKAFAYRPVAIPVKNFFSLYMDLK